MICPKCGHEIMQVRSSHDENWIYQYECDNCDYIIGVPYGSE